MNRPTSPTPQQEPQPTPGSTSDRSWNPARLFETLTYFDVLPFSDTMRWLQSLWSGGSAASSPMLFAPDSVTSRRPIVGLLDPLGTLPSGLAAKFEVLGLATLDLGDGGLARLTDRDLLVAIVVGAAANFPAAELDGAIARLDADLTPQTVFDFSREDIDLRALWGSVDDVVMGGVSESQAIAMPKTMRFAGNVSTANSGGFASIRTRAISPALDLRGVAASEPDAARQLGANTGLELRLTGDGNRYKFILRDREAWDGVAHCYSFDTQPDAAIAVRVPFAECVPTFRAKSVPDSPRLDGSAIAAFQLMLSKFEYDRQLNPAFTSGAFQLDVASVSAYRKPVVAPIVMAGETAAIAVLRSALGDRAAGLNLRQLDLATAIAAISRNSTDADNFDNSGDASNELTASIARHFTLA